MKLRLVLAACALVPVVVGCGHTCEVLTPNASLAAGLVLDEGDASSASATADGVAIEVHDKTQELSLTGRVRFEGADVRDTTLRMSFPKFDSKAQSFDGEAESFLDVPRGKASPPQRLTIRVRLTLPKLTVVCPKDESATNPCRPAATGELTITTVSPGKTSVHGTTTVTSIPAAAKTPCAD